VIAGAWAVWARVVPAVGLLPLGGAAPRLVGGAVLATLLAERSAPAATDVVSLVREAALGAALGVLASIPAHAAGAVRADGPETLGLAGRLWGWAVFFGMGGPGMLLIALGNSFRAVPAGTWPDLAAVARSGGMLLHAALVLGLPAWLTGLLAAPLAGLAERAGVGGLAAVRPAVGALLLAALLPLLLDEMRGYWLTALAAP
jgi:hypothetical protein